MGVAAELFNDVAGRPLATLTLPVAVEWRAAKRGRRAAGVPGRRPAGRSGASRAFGASRDGVEPHGSGALSAEGRRARGDRSECSLGTGNASRRGGQVTQNEC